MAVSIDQLDEFQEDLDEVTNPILEQEQPVTPVIEDEPEQPKENDSFIQDYLKTKGISDLDKIKFEDENNNITERSWDSLSTEEKYNILNSSNTPAVTESNNDLTDEEIELLNNIRSSNMTPSQYLQSIQSEQVPNEPRYQVDDLSDDELFILDLESRVGEITDDQAAEALNLSKQNEDLFKKQVEGIRREYKQRESELLQQQQAEEEQQQQEAYNQFQDTVIDQITNFNSIGNLDLNLDDEDKNTLARFMLERDDTGNSYLWQALQEPDNLVKAAWFILNGEDALNSISDYFVNQIKLVSKNQYNKGYNEGKNGSKPSRPEVVITQPPTRNEKPKNDYDLF